MSNQIVVGTAANSLGGAPDEIRGLLGTFRHFFKSVMWLSFVMNLLMLAPTFYMLQVYDRVMASHNEMTLVMLSIAVVLAFGFYSFLDYMRSLIVIRIGNRFDTRLNERIYTAAFRANLQQKGVNAGQALNDLTAIRQFLTGQTLFSVLDAPWFPINLAIIFLFNVKVGLFALVGAVLLVVLTYYSEKTGKNPLKMASDKSIMASNMASNTLRNADVIEAMGMLGNLKARWHKIHLHFLALQAHASEKVALISALTKFVRSTWQSLILGLGAYLALSNDISPGMMMAGSILMGRVLSPIEGLIGVWKQLDSTRNSYGRLQKLLAASPPEQEAMSLPAPEGHLSVEQASVAPPGSSKVILKGITFAIEPGDVLGILGPSGAGKSTLAKMLVGVWQPNLGKVRLDSADVHQWNKLELGKFVGYLPQDIELFAGTVSENIARFAVVDSEKVVKAAKLVGLHDVILRLPKGYDTVITDAGASLSGGQRQRIGLARAVYDDPQFIVLDEPNSNADDAGENALVKLLESLRAENKTVILITHRTRILNQTTKLLLLNEGALQFFDTTAKVLEKLREPQQQRLA